MQLIVNFAIFFSIFKFIFIDIIDFIPNINGGDCTICATCVTPPMAIFVIESMVGHGSFGTFI